jgi:hypothetical protein
MLLKAGKRTREWQHIREQLKPRFEGCWRDNGLSFAHVDKRRFLSEKELREPALACIPCHNKLELMPRDQMRATVEKVIANRVMQP